MKRKTITNMVAVMSLAAMMLTGCGASSQPATSGSDTDAAVTGGNEELTGRTIKVMSIYNENTECGEVIRVLTDEYLEANPDASVEIEYISQEDHIQKLSVLAASGELPDLFIEGDSAQAYTFYSKGLLKSVDEFMEETGTECISDTVREGLLNLQIGTDTLYTLPSYQAIEGWWYNTDIFEQYNLKVPTTMDEFIVVCDSLMENGVQPIAVAGKAQWPVTRLIGGYITSKLGTDALPDANNGILSWESEEFLEAYQWVADLNSKGYFGEGAVTADLTTEYQLFVSGQAAMVYDGSWIASQLSADSNQIGYNVGFFGWPQVEGGAGTPDNCCQNYGVTWCIGSANYDADLADYCSYVFSNYGDRAMELQKSITGFNIYQEHELDEFTELIYSIMESAGTPSVWPEYHMPSEGMTTFMDNSQLLLTGDMSASEFGAEIQQVMDSY